jgi:nucleotide-binding universal stress UspA family protein
MQTVLFATDFSEASEPAGRVAVEIARSFGARLCVVHVVPPVTDASVAAERVAATARALGVKVDTVLLSGRAAAELVAYARDKRADLIVIGTHGRTGVSRVLLGSVAEHVVRAAPCPVLTVPMPELARAEEPATEPEPAGIGPHRCVVCARETPDLVCEPCRARIRSEALEQKVNAERPGRRGSPA